MKLHQYTVLYISKEKERINNDQKLQLYAEYLAFDQIYREFKIEKEVLECARILYNLVIKYS